MNKLTDAALAMLKALQVISPDQFRKLADFVDYFDKEHDTKDKTVQCALRKMARLQEIALKKVNQ